jgi:hypothetical protein
MIRRDGEGVFLLIRQHDHGLLAGYFASQVGNALYPPPMPRRPVLTAIAQHDCGWQEWDDRPRLDGGGNPAHAFNCDLEVAVSAWGASVERVAEGHPYAGLLVSLHVLALALEAASRSPAIPPTDEAAERRRQFVLSRFIQRQIQQQMGLRASLGLATDKPLRAGLGDSDEPVEELLAEHLHLLQFLDALSLNACFDRLLFPRFNEVRMDREGDGCIRLDPWPFGVERVESWVPAAQIAARGYKDEAEVASAMAAAPRVRVAVRLRPWSAA